MGRRIVIMAGGTGGHVFPALAVAEKLRSDGWNVSWLGTQKGLEARVIPEHQIEIDWLSVSGLRGKGLSSKFKSIFHLMKACWQAFTILRRRKPNVVLGMGGFVAAPGGMMAKLLGIPLVIHEQNRVVGTTNKLLSKIATRKLEAFPDSFPAQMKALCTGNPLRAAFMKLPQKVNKASSTGLNIAIVGGSQGAQILNELLPKALAKIESVRVKHQTGSAMQKDVESAYQALNIQAESLAFIEDMPALYQWADLVICRAGAMTVSEVSACGLPAIFIPLPQAIDDHQSANARYLSEDQAALLLPQNELTVEGLVVAINQVSNNLEIMSKKSKNKARLKATATVAAICTEVAV
ncbi:MAG: undecaprenyldiphospho-muramoylpentapeptide beta-N-acetylglucosaminyltransferase [Methylococcales bacterium]|nr:undecaprenyldiphospho-muramoylpentapeptide beta-N-acetylglucosaminyltransferase [Methylococcales bacterium]MCK5925990.1 undecaprenyldiphospho-muramoylpentapeptide beta-N-acetylglucosaminyltransferase [Methylococcales bacterium]